MFKNITVAIVVIASLQASLLCLAQVLPPLTNPHAIYDQNLRMCRIQATALGLQGEPLRAAIASCMAKIAATPVP